VLIEFIKILLLSNFDLGSIFTERKKRGLKTKQYPIKASIASPSQQQQRPNA
jgi:hypothetical protein